MPGPLTAEEREAFLAEPRIAVVGIARGGDRPPHLTPVWYAYQPGGDLTFFTSTQGRRSRKADLLDVGGTLSVLVQRDEFPYAYVSFEGTVVRADRPPTTEQVLAIVRRYLPEEQAQGFAAAELGRPAAESRFVLFTVRPDRWHSFDFGDDAG